MIEISVNQLSKYFGAKQVFANISLEIMTGDRVGLIGSNGCGKTTLLKVLQGSEDYQSGSIQIRKDARIRYLDQFMDFGTAMTVQEVCESAFHTIRDLRVRLGQLEQTMADAAGFELDRAVRQYGQAMEQFELLGGYEAETRLEMVLQGLEIPPALRRQIFARLSGGEKTRVALARMLLEDPDILLLDEPSNHLDIPAVEWLENFLKTYKGTVLMVSHDRCFLDRTVTQIIELHADHAEAYIGNYSSYVIEKEQRFQLALREYENQQKKIERMEEQIQRFKIWAAMRDSEVMEHNTKVMERKLAKIERLDRPVIDKAQMKLNMDVTRRAGKEVLKIAGLGKTFGSRQILADLDLQLFYRDRACLLGRNGCGKSTLLKLILQELPADSGSIRLGAGLTIGYLPQEVAFDDEEQTLLAWFSRRYQITTGEARSELARALFRKDDVHKQIKNLSGGERSRLRLCALCYEKVNLLIMDEPTNHLDIESREVLEGILQNYEGTLLFVSHDRYFIDKVADQILVLADGRLQAFRMSYTEYSAEVQARRERAANLQEPQADPVGRVRQKNKNDSNARGIARPAAKPVKPMDLAQLESLIEQAEAEQKTLDADILAYGCDASRLTELYQEKDALDRRLDRLLQQWEEQQGDML